MPDAVERIARLDGLLPVHGLIGFLTGMIMIQLELADEDGAGFAIAAAIALAGIVAAVVLAGRESRGLRWIAYVGFAVELCLIYGVMIQDMLGTAGFFLAAGVILGLLAFAIIRIEKRMKEPRLPRGSSGMSGNKLLVAAVLLAFAQIGFLSWIIAGRAAILRDGQEVLLKVEPVDPRDLLRGDYVRAGLRDHATSR